jgi:glutamine synthetase type III
VQALATVLAEVVDGARRLGELLAELDGLHDEEERARRLASELRPLMAAVRAAADRLERGVDDDLWSYPKYREMLFVK